MFLKERFSKCCNLFTGDLKLVENLWSELDKRYCEKSRFYHNFDHLKCMFSELDDIKNNIENFEAVSFAVFYHDVIYNAVSKSNEEKSAEVARKNLQKLGFDSTFIQKVSDQIIATKFHKQSDDNDINYLLDADLSILGSESEKYVSYTQKIRKEYSIYPDLLYKPGRKKALEHFLKSESIFKTEYFKEKYELRARENILSEIEALSLG
jgi:predicted metal-dependent HD superfamily phosphohydrolase